MTCSAVLPHPGVEQFQETTAERLSAIQAGAGAGLPMTVSMGGAVLPAWAGLGCADERAKGKSQPKVVWLRNVVEFRFNV